MKQCEVCAKPKISVATHVVDGVSFELCHACSRFMEDERFRYFHAGMLYELVDKQSKGFYQPKQKIKQKLLQ